MWLSEMSKKVGLQGIGWKSGGSVAIVGRSFSFFNNLNSSKLSANICSCNKFKIIGIITLTIQLEWRYVDSANLIRSDGHFQNSNIMI
jgi:hypothetical protein